GLPPAARRRAGRHHRAGRRRGSRGADPRQQPPASRPRHGPLAAAPRKLNLMPKERLYLFDTTLRDGAQTAGIEFSLEDKISVAALLDELGVDYVEGGFPGANVVDDAFFSENRTRRATFTAFGMTRRSGRSVG